MLGWFFKPLTKTLAYIAMNVVTAVAVAVWTNDWVALPWKEALVSSAARPIYALCAIHLIVGVTFFRIETSVEREIELNKKIATGKEHERVTRAVGKRCVQLIEVATDEEQVSRIYRVFKKGGN